MESRWDRASAIGLATHFPRAETRQSNELFSSVGAVDLSDHPYRFLIHDRDELLAPAVR